ncbi:MAG: phospholipase D-like domain-containing protein [Bdellovibrionota bacterium]
MKRPLQILKESAVWVLFFFAVSPALAEPKPWIGKFTADRIVVASSPENTFQILKRVISQAQDTIYISVYILDNVYIADELERAISERKVKVHLLLEGSPVPKVPEVELYIAKRLTELGAKAYFYDLGEGRAHRRFKYLHNKYAVIDKRWVVVGSANYGSRGHPLDPSYGNREWEVVIEDPAAVKLYLNAFAHDARKRSEWVAYGKSERYRLKDPSFEPERKVRKGSYPLRLKPIEVHDVPALTLFSPDNSLDEKKGMLAYLKKAKRSVWIEQLTLERYWGLKTYNPEPEPSKLIQILYELAEKGVGIRVLLNDDNIFREKEAPMLFEFEDTDSTGFSWIKKDSAQKSKKPPRDNRSTIQELMAEAKKHAWDLKAHLFDHKNCDLRVLHNKGMIVDGELTMIGSLNWGESALKFNREAGILLKSGKVAGYYQKTFEYDWKCSARNTH